jgi:thiamine-monophosphate kinase
MTTLRQLGEDLVVERLVGLLPRLSEAVVQGPGDDCAVLKVTGTAKLQLLKTDAVVEGVHFLGTEDMERVGWKALCRAVSDIAAMGGRPESALITVLARADTPWERLEGLYRGIARAASRFGVSIVGGETGQIHGPLACNVCLTGWVDPERVVLRSGGRPGDVLLVTGTLGGSLHTGRHLDFQPRLEEAAWLVEHFRPSAMMDLSDGLAKDGPRLAAASGCAFGLELERVPCTAGYGLEQALGDGEDFELLMAVAPGEVARIELAWRETFPELLLSRIGALLPKSDSLLPADAPKTRGYDHFQES